MKGGCGSTGYDYPALVREEERLADLVRWSRAMRKLKHTA